MTVFERTVALIEEALVEAWSAGQRGEPTPDSGTANAVTWRLLRLASHSLSRED